MKRSIRQRIREWLYADENEKECIEIDSDSRDNELDVSNDNALHFTVIPAAGGRIVKVQYYDHSKDRTITKLSIVTPDEDLSVALTHILQIEVLSR